jgi:hypothetical protein
LENYGGVEIGSWSRSGSWRIVSVVWMNVFVVGCDEWRRDVCQASLEKNHDDETGIVEEIVGEEVDVGELTDDG